MRWRKVSSSARSAFVSFLFFPSVVSCEQTYERLDAYRNVADAEE